MIDINKTYDEVFSKKEQKIREIKDKEEGYDIWKNANLGKLKQMILDALSRLSPTGTKSLEDEIKDIANACNIPEDIVRDIMRDMITHIVDSYWGNVDINVKNETAQNYPWVKDPIFVSDILETLDALDKVNEYKVLSSFYQLKRLFDGNNFTDKEKAKEICNGIEDLESILKDMVELHGVGNLDGYVYHLVYELNQIGVISKEQLGKIYPIFGTANDNGIPPEEVNELFA